MRILAALSADAHTRSFIGRCAYSQLPEADRHELFAWTEHTFDFKGTRNAYEQTDESIAAAVQMWEYGTQLIADKRAHPADDMLSVVVHAHLADEDPPTLDDEELRMFFSLLFAAGSETRHRRQGGVLGSVSQSRRACVRTHRRPV